MFAVIKTGGKQYLVQAGDELKIEKIEAEPGQQVKLETLLKADEQMLEVGAPVLSQAVQAEVMEHGRADKIQVVKYKAKSRYTRRRGHRQHFTKIKITSLA